MGRALAVVHGSMDGAGLRGLMGREEGSGLVMEAAEAKAEEVAVAAMAAAVEGVERRLVSALAGIKAIMAALEAAAAVLAASAVAAGVASAVAAAVLVATVVAAELLVATVVAAGVASAVAAAAASVVETLVGSVVVSMEKMGTAVEDTVAVTALVDTAAPVLAPEMVMSLVATEVGLGIRARGSSAVEAGASVVISAAGGRHTRTVAATTEAARPCLQPTTSNGRKYVVYRAQKYAL